MSLFSHAITPTLRITFNSRQTELNVHKLHILIPEFKGEWQQVATFSNEKEWHESTYYEKVNSTYMKEMIAWFWIDHRVSIADKIST
jgi:hypothetical protein